MRYRVNWGRFDIFWQGDTGWRAFLLRCLGQFNLTGTPAMQLLAGLFRITLACPILLGPGLVGAFGAGVFGAGAFGQSAPVQRDIAPRRVAVPGKQGGPRITVQIDPTEQAGRLIAKPKARPGAGAGPAEPAAGAGLQPVMTGQDFGWYWDLVPTSRDESADHYSLAMASLSNGPGGAMVPGPRLQYLQDMAVKYGIEILKATVGTKVSPALVLAVIGMDGARRPDAPGAEAAVGLMKLSSATADRFGVTDAGDPVQSIKGAIAYLDRLMVQFDHDPLLVLAAYNAGEAAVMANKGVPPYPETRAWVPKALAAWQVAQGLCMTSPELMSDPCVFRVLAAGQKN